MRITEPKFVGWASPTARGFDRFPVVGDAHPTPTPGHLRGFTLVEVLVALAVLAIALAALMRSLGQSIDVSYALRERTLATWIAQDRLVMHQLKLDWPGPDTTEGEDDVSGEKWFWREKVIATPEPKMRRIEISIRRNADSENFQAMLAGYLRQPK